MCSLHVMQSLFLRHREIFWPSIPDPSVIFKPMMNENNDLRVYYTVIENTNMDLPALSTHCSLFFSLQEGICTRQSQNRSMLVKSDSYLKTTLTSIPLTSETPGRCDVKTKSAGLSSCRNEGINEEGILFSLSP